MRMLTQHFKNQPATSFLLTAVFLLFSVLLCFFFALQFEIYEGGADNYIHYRVSRYAFAYPELFLDHWGKPVFTLVSVPFAQFGFKGFLFFNSLFGVLAGYFSYRICRELKLAEAWTAFIFILFMPMFLTMIPSAMTEVFFGFVLVFSVFLFLREKYVFSAILFSTLFLIRTEGYLFYPFIFLAFALRKKWKTLPFLITFPLLYSIIGGIYFGDFFWLYNQIPYGDSSDLYGKGELLFFVKKHNEIFGKPIAVLIFVGGIIAGIQALIYFFKAKKIKEDFILIEVLFFIYFAAHSYVWWSGTGASAGLPRVMAAVLPLAGITAVRSVDFIIKRNWIPILYSRILCVVFCVYVAWYSFTVFPIPYKFGEREKTIYASVEWFKNSKYAAEKAYFYEPLVYFLLDRDPFDHSVIKELIDDHEHPENVTKPGEIVFYDMHFGPNEGRLPLKNLMDNPYFKLVNYFEPLEPFTVLGGYQYAVLLFERVDNHSGNNHDILEKIKKSKSKEFLWNAFAPKPILITQDEFTPVVEVKANEIFDINEHQLIRVKMKYEYPADATNFESMLVISIEREGKAVIYKADLLKKNKEGIFENITTEVKLSEKLNGDETIKIYIWSKSKQEGIIHAFDVYLVKKTY